MLSRLVEQLLASLAPFCPPMCVFVCVCVCVRERESVCVSVRERALIQERHCPSPLRERVAERVNERERESESYHPRHLMWKVCG